MSEIDCAVGMSDEIDDDAAIAFAAAFYEVLGYGRSVQECLRLGPGATRRRGSGSLARQTIQAADGQAVGHHAGDPAPPSVASDAIAGGRSEVAGDASNQVAFASAAGCRAECARAKYSRHNRSGIRSISLLSCLFNTTVRSCKSITPTPTKPG